MVELTSAAATPTPMAEVSGQVMVSAARAATAVLDEALNLGFICVCPSSVTVRELYGGSRRHSFFTIRLIVISGFTHTKTSIF